MASGHGHNVSVSRAKSTTARLSENDIVFVIYLRRVCGVSCARVRSIPIKRSIIVKSGLYETDVTAI